MEDFNLNVNNNGGYDPIHSLLVRRKQERDFGQLPSVDVHSKDDVRALEEFCRKYGILGGNFGNMSPKGVLAMLKSKMGIKPELTENRKILLKG